MKKQKPLSNQELVQFCEHMAMVLKAGLTPAAGIELMLDDAASREGRDILRPIAEKCNEGASFPDALAASGVFPKYALHMIEIGNVSGNLDEVMDSLVYHYTREEALARGIKNAVLYPFIIVVMMLAVITVLVIKVLPIFRKVFRQLGSDMTGFSRSLLHLGDTLTAYSAVFIGVFVVLVAAFVFFTCIPSGKALLRRFFASFPLTRRFADKVGAARFASGMAMMISAGLDMEKSLDLIEKLVNNRRLEAKIRYCRKLTAGTDKEAPVSFTKALAESRIFTNVYSKMVGIGFSTGSAERVLENIAAHYDTEIEEDMNKVVSVLEPTLVIILSVIVCLILLSVIMPLMGIMTGIG